MQRDFHKSDTSRLDRLSSDIETIVQMHEVDLGFEQSCDVVVVVVVVMEGGGTRIRDNFLVPWLLLCVQ